MVVPDRFVFVVATTAFLVGVATSNDDGAAPANEDDPIAAWREHERSVHQFGCEHPQRRSVKVSELLKGQLKTSEIIVPHTTVLHRCDAGTGCCAEKLKECRVAKVEEVRLYFYVVDIISKKEGVKTFMVTNHTLCSCQAFVNDIK